MLDYEADCVKPIGSHDYYEATKREVYELCAECTAACKKTVPDIAKVYQYVEAIRRYEGSINYNALYEIIKTEYLIMLKNGTARSTDTRCLKRVSKLVKGDSFAWESELTDDLKKCLALRRTKPRYELAPEKLYRVFRIPNVLHVFARFGVRDDLTAYDACKSVLFDLLKNGYDKENLREVKNFYDVREMVEEYALALGKQQKEWKYEYSEFLNTGSLVVRKIARDGSYERITYTEEEIAALKQRDEQLNDLDEDL